MASLTFSKIFVAGLIAVCCAILLVYHFIYRSASFAFDIGKFDSLGAVDLGVSEKRSAVLPQSVLSGLYSESYARNKALFDLSSIERSAIRSAQWQNPSVVTASTIVVGYCCETPDNFECALQEFVLILSMAIWNGQKHNLFFQKCLKSGLAPSHVNSNSRVSIKQRRDPSLNQNGTASWQVIARVWFEPDMYLCQGYFWDQSLIDTRANTRTLVEVDHNDNIDLLADNIVFPRAQVPSHALSTYRPLLLTTNTEFWGGGKCKRYDIVFDTVMGRGTTGCVSIHAPPAFWYEFMRTRNDTIQLILPSEASEKQRWLENVLTLKQDAQLFHTLFLVKFCFVPGRYMADVLVRVVFFDMLRDAYITQQNDSVIPGIDSLSWCRRDEEAVNKIGDDFVQRGSDATYGYQGVRDGAVQIAMRYKFMIAMENSRTRGYMTEKFMNALYAHTIPIYFGDDMIDHYFNDKRFINCNISNDHAQKVRELTRQNDREKIENKEESLYPEVKNIVGDTLAHCVKRVMEVDADDNKYKAMIMEPIFQNNTYDGSILDPFAMASKFRKVAKVIGSYLVTDS